MTCAPCKPTRLKKADRKALRDGPAPRATMPTNSLISKPEERGAEHEREREGKIETPQLTPLDGQQAKPAGVAREQQTERLNADMAQLEQLAARGSPGSLSGQHRVGGEQRREHDDVGEQEDPKSIADDDSHRRRPLAAPRHRRAQSGELRSAHLRAHGGAAARNRARSASANCSPDTSSS